MEATYGGVKKGAKPGHINVQPVAKTVAQRKGRSGNSFWCGPPRQPRHRPQHVQEALQEERHIVECWPMIQCLLWSFYLTHFKSSRAGLLAEYAHLHAGYLRAQPWRGQQWQPMGRVGCLPPPHMSHMCSRRCGSHQDETPGGCLCAAHILRTTFGTYFPNRMNTAVTGPHSK